MARRPSEEETALWRRAMHDVRPRRRAHAAKLPETMVAPPTAPVPPQPSVAVPTPAPNAAPAAATGTGLDHRSAQRLKRGELAIEGRLDLHGMTQEEAHDALNRFVARMHGDGRRVVLVITGKGARDGEGILRRAVPRWLAEPRCRPLVVATSEAQPRHGGAGALYILLRRKR
jgi:DNA-nicking Smr family endonuclease